MEEHPILPALKKLSEALKDRFLDHLVCMSAPTKLSYVTIHAEIVLAMDSLTHDELPVFRKAHSDALSALAEVAIFGVPVSW